MGATLVQLRGQHEKTRADAAKELHGLDGQRAALALDDPEALEGIDSERARLQVVVDHEDLALEELTRREQAEKEAQAEQERKALGSQLLAALAARKKDADSSLDLAEALGDAVQSVRDLDARVWSLAKTLGADDQVRPAENLLRISVRLRMREMELPPSHREGQDKTLAAYLDMKPV
jgi:hypothetical protein